MIAAAGMAAVLFLTGCSEKEFENHYKFPESGLLTLITNEDEIR